MDCLSDDRVLGFVRGELPSAEREAVETHLDACQSCFRLVGTAMRMSSGEAAQPPAPGVTAQDELDEADGTASLVPSEIADGRYVVRDLLGQGGAGAVYRAFDSQLGRQIALKIVRAPKLAADAAESMQARLLREARAMARVSHPNVVAVYDVGSIGDRVFVVMELVEGRTLASWQTEKAHGWREVIETFSAAGVGLAAAHRVGLVHRDFKPLNVLVGTDGRVRVTDFGLARPVAQADSGDGTPSGDSLPEGHHDWTLTMTGGLVGTPRYMAPEQFRAGPADARSDQFSFCVALFTALYGQHPFFANGNKKPPLPELATLVMAGVVVTPAEIPGLPPGVLKVLRRGLRVDPAERYPNMDLLIVDLSRQLEPSKLGASRRRRLALASLAAAALLAGLYLFARSAVREDHFEHQSRLQPSRPALQLSSNPIPSANPIPDPDPISQPEPVTPPRRTRTPVKPPSKPTPPARSVPSNPNGLKNPF